MSDKKETNTIQKPKLTLNDTNKFYLATGDFTGESESGLFFVLSLYLPVKNGTIMIQPHTEVSAFDDANSAIVYQETLARYCAFNVKSSAAQMVKDIIKDFNERKK